MNSFVKAFSVLLLTAVAALTSFGTQHTVTVQSYSFTPPNLTIAEGDTVVWNNISGFHSVHHVGNPSRFGNTAGNSPWTYMYAFNGIGDSTFHYVCQIHPTSMMGTITVQASGPTITLTSPNGSENWFVGESHQITWTSTNVDTTVMLEINRNYPSGTWETLAPSIPNSGSQAWTVTGPVGTSCRVRVSVVGQPTANDISDANFSIASPSISVTAPNGGEMWLVGSIQNVDWSSTGVSGEMDVAINRDYPSGAWQTVMNLVPNSGQYAWMVNGPTSAACRIRVSSHDNPSIAGMSAAEFSIIAPTINVMSPNGGENWDFGSMQAITWSAQSVTGLVTIELNRSFPSSTWEQLGTDQADAGSHAWTVSGNPSPNCRIRITSQQTLAADTSDASFTISASNAVGDLSDAVPTAYALRQNYPNPFNPSTDIVYDMKETGRVSITVYDLLGRQVAVLANGVSESGTHVAHFDGANLPSGLYLCRMQTNGFAAEQKMLLLK